jgi:hypothetical protein
MNEALAVKRGLEIQEKLAELKTELSAVEEFLKKRALNGTQIELEDADREGRQYIARSEHFEVPVILSADLLIKSFKHESAQHLKIESDCDGKLKLFYAKKITYEVIHPTGKAFRKEALSVLGEQGPEFITACVARDKNGIPKSVIQIDWGRSRIITE